MSDLRPYQQAAKDALRKSLLSGNRSPLLVLPCGGGKTHIAKSIIEDATAKGKRTLFLAPRRELVYQTCEKLDEVGLDYGIIMAGESKSMFAPVQVGCIPTVHRRLEHTLPPPADLIIIDEAHLSIAKSTRTVLDAYPNARKIGLTATPIRKDGRGLGEVYDDLVMGPTVTSLMDQGYLVKTEYFAPSAPDLEGVKIQMGDYNQKQIGERMLPLVGDVVTNWLRIAPDRPTVVFSVNVAHSRYLCDSFKEAGVAAEHLDARTPNEDRKAILERLKRGTTQVLTNCDILSYGWDCPPISCAVLARPTKSLARYLQAAGRVLRPYPGKETTIIIDHTGVIEELGFVEDEFPWSLDGDETIEERQGTTERKEPKPLTCPKCSTIFEGTDICPACGHRMTSEFKQAQMLRDAELAKVDKALRKATGREWTMSEKQDFFSELYAIAKERGYKPGWASMKYKERLGVWPNPLRKVSKPPTPETRSWVKSRQIAWAKSKNRAA